MATKFTIKTTTGEPSRFSGFYFGMSGTGVTTRAIEDAINEAGRIPLVVTFAAADTIESYQGLSYIQINSAEAWDDLVSAISGPKGIKALGDFDALLVDGIGQLVPMLFKKVSGGATVGDKGVDARRFWGEVAGQVNADLQILKGSTEYLAVTTRTRLEDGFEDNPLKPGDKRPALVEDFDLNPATLDALKAHLGRKIFTFTLVKKNNVYYGVERNSVLALAFTKTKPTEAQNG